MKHKLYNRLLSLALAVGLVVGMLPGSAAVSVTEGSAGQAVTLANGNAGQVPDGLEISKTIEKDVYGNYNVKLEAYTTGKITSSGGDPVPADIVLVLDMSGSMEYCMNCGEPEDDCNCRGTYEKTYDIKTDGTYYRSNNQGSYSRVYYCNTCKGWYTEKHSTGIFGNHKTPGQKLTPKTSSGSSGTQFYKETGGFVPRIDALKQAVNGFIDSVAKDAIDNKVDHKISIVKFAGDKSTQTGNDTYKYDGNTYNYSQIVKGLTVASSGQTELKNAVNSLQPNGSTRIDYGLERANAVLTGSAQKGRNRIVVAFTDGEPSSFSSFDDGVANGAISQANTLKNSKGATVYSVGVFSGADGTDPANLPSYNSDKTNRFMHLVSSNYPDATKVKPDGRPNYNTNTGELNPDIDPKDPSDSYYLAASDEETLNNIFQQISDEVQGGGSSFKLDGQAVIKDVMSDTFQLPEGTEQSDVTVEYYKAEYSENTLSWTRDTSYNPQITKQITKDSKDKDVVNVSGFDFDHNFVAETGRVEGDATKPGDFHGRKIVIQFPIEVKEGFFGGNNVPTNDSASGIYKNSTENTPVGQFEIPNLNVPVNYAAAAKDQSIYITQNASVENMIKFESGYQPNGWNNSHVTIAYQVKDGDEVIGTYTIQPGKTTGVWSGNNVSPEDCTNYTITCTVTPNTGTNDSVNNPVVGDWTGNASAKVHVFTPVVKWQDSTQYKGTKLTGNLLNRHNVSVTWADAQSDGAAAPSGNAPNLNFKFNKKGDSGDLTDQALTNEIDVQVKVMIGSKDITSASKFEWEKGQACTDACEAAPTNAQFRIHTYELIEGQLTVTKEWQTKTGTSVAGENVPFDKVEVTLEQYYMVGTGDNLTEKTVDTDVLELTHENGWTDSYDPMVQDYTLFRATEEKVYDGDKLIVTYTLNKGTGEWTATWTENAPEGSIYRDWDIHGFEFEREYGSATTQLNVVHEKNDIEFTISGGGLVVIQATANEGYVIWMPYMDTLSESAKSAIIKAVKTELKLSNKTVSFVSDDFTLGNADITYNNDGTVHLLFPGQSTWANFWYGGFSFGNSVITNSLINTLDTDAQTQVSVNKVWDDSNNPNRPNSVTVNLMNGNQEVREVVLNDTNGWKHTFTDLPKYNANGSLIQYTVTEDAVSGYTTSITGDMNMGFTITNTREVGSLTITKTVEGLENDPDTLAILKNQLTFTVTGPNGYKDTVAFNATGWTNNGNIYTYTINNLPTGAYTVEESGHELTEQNYNWKGTKPEGSQTIIKDGNVTFAFTNTYTPAEQTLKIYKNLSGFANEGKPVFSFKITDLDTGDVWYYHIDMTDKDIKQNVLVIELTLPAGHEYRVEELSNQNYEFVQLTQDGQVINPIPDPSTRELIIENGGQITLNTDTELVFFNAPVNSNIPTDGGATENKVLEIKEGIIAWKPTPVQYGNDHDDNITPDPDAE